jgi:fumarate hydratase class II
MVVGNDVAVSFGGSAGFLQLNTMKPLLAHVTLQSIRLLGDAAASFERISSASKTVQFKLARMARQKREVDLGPDVAEMAAAWDEGMSRLTDRLAR